MGEYTSSTYQQAIFDFVQNGRGDGVVNAVAGSGKTHTLVEAARLIRSEKALFVAFNKHIQQELSARLAGTSMVAKTIHSVGASALYRELGKTNLQEHKYDDLARAWVDENKPNREKKGDLRHTLSTLVDFARFSLIDPHDYDALIDLADYHDLECPGDVIHGVEPVLKEGLQQARYGKVIDFTDMLWLPYTWGLTPYRQDWVFVDEAQDLSALALEMVLKCRAPGGRMLFVGDPRQAIYAFAGADAFSFANIIRRTNARELPLSICYRCPKSHIDLAQQIVPHIEARPDAPDGIVEHVSIDNISEVIHEGDLIISRKNAPLMSLCIKLIAQGIAARVKGRDIGRGLNAVLRDISETVGFTYDKLPEHVESYLKIMDAKYAGQKRGEAKMRSLDDKCESLLACFENFKTCKSVDALHIQIEQMFSDNRPSVWLSSVHKAKGLENETVIIINPEDMPLRWKNQLAWEEDQEWNLKYVALTRAKEKLIIAKGGKS